MAKYLIVLCFGLSLAQDQLLSSNTVFLQDISTLEKANQAKQFVSEKSEDLTRINCLLFTDMTFFDLRSLENDTQPYQINNMYFQFCRRLEAGSTKTFAYQENVGVFTTSYTVFTDGSSPSNVVAVQNDSNPDQPRHIKFELDGGDVCSTDSNRKLSVRYEVFCDPSVQTQPSLTAANLDWSDPCSPKLSFSHKSGCPVFEATSIVRFLSENPWAMGILLLIFGSFVAFFGGKFFSWVLAGVAGSLVFLLVLLFGSIFGAFKSLDQGRDASPGYITLAVMTFLVALGLGILVGWLIKHIQRAGICVMGTVAGFLLGFLVYTFVFAPWFDHVGLLIGLTATGALVFGWLSYKFDRYIIIYLTAFFGSYALIRGISMFAGGYPNEVLLYQQLQNNAFEGLPWTFYLYVVLMVATGVGAVFFQIKRGYQKHYEEEEIPDGYMYQK